jgi:alpha-L-fucosidase
VIDLQRPQTFNTIRVRENLRLGQRVEAFAVDAWRDGSWREIAAATSIGSCRLIRTAEDVTAARVRLRVTQSPVAPALSEIALFQGPRTTA